MRSQAIRFIQGRVTFVGALSPAPFPSAVVIFAKRSPAIEHPRIESWDWRESSTRRSRRFAA
jgi:hypothetical protein